MKVKVTLTTATGAIAGIYSAKAKTAAEATATILKKYGKAAGAGPFTITTEIK